MLPSHTHSHTPPPAVTPHWSSLFVFLLLFQHKNLTPLMHEDGFKMGERRKRWKHVVPLSSKKNTTVLMFPCSHTEPIWREKTFLWRAEDKHCVLNGRKIEHRPLLFNRDIKNVLSPLLLMMLDRNWEIKHPEGLSGIKKNSASTTRQDQPPHTLTPCLS